METGVNSVPYDVNMIIYPHKLPEVSKTIQTFESCDDLFEAVGEVLQEVDQDKNEDDIKVICDKMYKLVKPSTAGEGGGGNKLKL